MVEDQLDVLARSAIPPLEAWIHAQQLSGYDPYDLRGTRLYLWCLHPSRRKSLPARSLRGAFLVLEDRFPFVLRRMLGVSPTLNAKGMGLLAKAYFNLYAKGLGDDMRRKALECLTWLRANPSPGFAGPCWGYPFDWQSAVLLPRGTPSSVVSWTVGDAFWQAYRMTGSTDYLDVCRGICGFFSCNLNRDEPRPGQLCFSYTPLDRMHVLNATLFVAEFLLRVGAETANQIYLRDGRAVVEYVVSNQNHDGSWSYFGPEDSKPTSIDHYHTGFVLRMLKSIVSSTGDERYREALRRGFAFYRSELFESSGLPRGFFKTDRPLNIHAVAEALLCLSRCGDGSESTRSQQTAILKFAMDQMRDPAGWFYFSKSSSRAVRFPFMRWGQAWMLLALSEVLVGGLTVTDAGAAQ